MSEQFTCVGNKLDSVNARMEEMETRQKTLEEAIGSSTVSPTTSISGSGKRKRITPAVLQVRIKQHEPFLILHCVDP